MLALSPREFSAPFSADVGRVWLRGAEVIPDAGTLTLALTAGWNHLEWTSYNQNAGTILNLDYPFAGEVDAMSCEPLPACDDGADNDTDGTVDYPADLGCRNPSWSTENPECTSGVDNDDPPLADWDGAGLGYPDPQCVAAWDKSESPETKPCGGGAELALLPLPLVWLYRRRSRSL